MLRCRFKSLFPSMTRLRGTGLRACGKVLPHGREPGHGGYCEQALDPSPDATLIIVLLLRASV
jgi:hypothetical protein